MILIIKGTAHSQIQCMFRTKHAFHFTKPTLPLLHYSMSAPNNIWQNPTKSLPITISAKHERQIAAHGNEIMLNKQYVKCRKRRAESIQVVAVSYERERKHSRVYSGRC